jgi:hypothetical protein
VADAKGSVPNLINGISQQSPAMRLASQAELSVNFMPVVADGNIKRPPTQHLTFLRDLPDDTFCHIILRDDVEEYVLTIETDGTVRVWTFAGVSKTVTNTGTAYLSGLTNAREQLRALTVADHTFIVNRTRTVSASSSSSPARPFEALVSVVAGNYGKKYRIQLNGVWAAEYETPDGSVASHTANVDTVFIAEQLRADLDAASIDVAPWGLGRYHSTVYIRNDSNDFTLATEDGYSGRNMKEVKREVQKFSDLPLYGPDGVKIKVTGTDSSQFDDYWVEFVKDDDLNSAGVWKECIAPNTLLGLNAATMPHVLVRESDGNFTFEAATWDDRVCGDIDSNPNPSFVGQTIEDIVFHKNRLGFLTGENAVLSASGDFYNFFRTTLTALLDTDPIDVAAAHVKVSNLIHAVPFQDVLLVFSDKTQFRLSGNETLTPKTVSLKPLTELSSIPRVRPVVSTSNVFFVAETGDWAQFYEYFLDKQFETADAEQVSSHAPSYVPAGVTHMASSSDLDLVAFITSGDPTAIYIYKFFWNGQEKVQSAWVKWDFPNAEAIRNITFDKSDLLVTVQRSNGWHFEKINCEPGQEEDFHLDRRVVLDNGSYNAGTGLTTFTLPYVVPTGIKAITYEGSDIPGIALTISSTTSSTVIVEGDYSSTPVAFGLTYESRYRFSRFYYRSGDGKVMQDGRLTIKSLSIAYTRSAFFRVEVTPVARATRTYIFNGRLTGDPDNLTGQIVTDDGKLNVPIMSRNDRVVIDLVSDSWLPCGFTSAEWRGTWNPSSRQL